MAETDRRAIDWSAAVWAGIIAGAVFLVLEMVMVPVFLDGSPWAPPKMIAAIVMGGEVLPSPEAPAGISASVLVVGLIVHFALSVAFAIIRWMSALSASWICFMPRR